jgi:hypothetical protein
MGRVDVENSSAVVQTWVVTAGNYFLNPFRDLSPSSKGATSTQAHIGELCETLPLIVQEIPGQLKEAGLHLSF